MNLHALVLNRSIFKMPHVIIIFHILFVMNWLKSYRVHTVMNRTTISESQFFCLIFFITKQLKGGI